MIAFINSFLSYLLLFAVCVAVVIAAVMIGIKLRKRKNQQEALNADQTAKKEEQK